MYLFVNHIGLLSRPVHLRIRPQPIDGSHAAGEHHEGGHLLRRVDNGLPSSSSRGLVHKPASAHSLSTVFSVHPATASKNLVAKSLGLVHIKAAFECGNLVFFFHLSFLGGVFLVSGTCFCERCISNLDDTRTGGAGH